MAKKVAISTSNVFTCAIGFSLGAGNLADEIRTLAEGSSFSYERTTLWLAIALLVIGILPLVVAQIQAMNHHLKLPTNDESKKLAIPVGIFATVTGIALVGLVWVIGIMVCMQRGVAFKSVSTELWAVVTVFGVITVVLLIIWIVGLIQRWRKKSK